MRAVWLWTWVLLACGGRTLDDAGAYQAGGSGGALGTPGAAGRSGGSAMGGAPSGVPGRGGTSSAGAPGRAGGPSAGNIGVAGQPSVGGGGSLPAIAECSLFCKSYYTACRDELGPSISDCIEQCAADTVGYGPGCGEAQRAALVCLAEALSAPAPSCSDAFGRASLQCVASVERANACQGPCPASEATISEGRCTATHFCSTGRYDLVCVAGPYRGVNCSCAADGMPVFSTTVDVWPPENACFESWLLEACAF